MRRAQGREIDVSIVIPTRDRAQLLARAVDSALAQTHQALEVIVIDDGSVDPVELPSDPRLRIVRHTNSRGSSASRNSGLHTARGRWVTFLDDDDRLLPHMVKISLEALAQTTLPPPVGVLSGLEVVDAEGDVLETKLPPTCLRGTWFGVEAIPGYPLGAPYETKQTLVIEREILLGVGGWNDGFQPRETTELFLRLSQDCSLLGLPVITYRQLRHDGPRLTSDPLLRDQGFERLIRTHRAVFEAHPEGYAHQLRRHAYHMRVAGHWDKCLAAWWHALRTAPASTISESVAYYTSRAGRTAVGRGRRGGSGGEL
jgi:glycosyltransferase involved in cell wall biosynthesis